MVQSLCQRSETPETLDLSGLLCKGSDGTRCDLAMKLNGGDILDLAYCDEDTTVYDKLTSNVPTISKTLPKYRSPYIQNVKQLSYVKMFKEYCGKYGNGYEKYRNMSVGIACGIINSEEDTTVNFQDWLKIQCLEYYLQGLDLTGKKWGWKYIISDKLQEE